MKKSLDLDAVRAFVLVADFSSFTTAADMMDTAQANISLKVKKLEERLGFQLLKRTPRKVGLSEEGATFINHARALLAAHDKALSLEQVEAPAKVCLGISDHVAGPELPSLIRKLHQHNPTISLELNVNPSRLLLEEYEGGRYDAILFRGDHDHMSGDLLFEEKLCWLAAPDYIYQVNRPLKLAALSSACGVRTLATDLLNKAGIAWEESFVGGGVASVGAAAASGLAMTVLAARIAPPGTIDVGDTYDLPPLPASKVSVKRRRRDEIIDRAVTQFLTAFRSTASR